ncbi:MAG: hypothetical protein ABIC57_01425 [bacterium]
MAITANKIHNLAERIRILKEELEENRDAKQDVLDTAENSEYPNEERIEKLTEQVDSLTEALDDLGTVVETLENYE